MEKTYNVLFLCTANSARSIMAEAALNIMGKGRFKAFSAGSFPGGKVNPYAIEIAKTLGYPTANLRSKSWDEFASMHFDDVVTFCDNAAGESCPAFLGPVRKQHWSIPDPAKATGTEEDVRKAFDEVFDLLKEKIATLL